jgi:hypothetical protein
VPKKKEVIPEAMFDPVEINKQALKGIFERAVKENRHLRPDEAMTKLFEYWKGFDENNPLPDEAKRMYRRMDDYVLTRKVHHAAVDLYYETYFMKQKGATPLSDDYLRHILSLSEQGLSYGGIAKEIGLPTSPPHELLRSKDKIRKQLVIAKSRLRKS